MTIRVTLVDDQAVARSGFRAILESEDDIEVVDEAADGRAAIEAVRRSNPDVVLMDVRMPTMDGIEATARLAGPDVVDPVDVLIITTFDLDEYVFRALRAGAVGFLLKDAPPDDIVAAGRGRPSDRPRARDPRGARRRLVERRDRRTPAPRGDHGQDPRPWRAHQARAARPGPGRRLRVRARTRGRAPLRTRH